MTAIFWPLPPGRSLGTVVSCDVPDLRNELKLSRSTSAQDYKLESRFLGCIHSQAPDVFYAA